MSNINLFASSINLRICKFIVSDSEKFYVEKINIIGNYNTIEDVFRNNLIVDEGDPFNEILYNKSINRIKSLGIFKKVETEVKGLKKIDKKSSAEYSTRLKHMILSIEGDYERKTVRQFVDNQLLARDSRALREYIKEIQPDVDLTFDLENAAGDVKGVRIPIGITFFWPDTEL